MAKPWCRWYSEAPRDPKLKRIAKLSGCSHLETVGAWAILLALANEAPGDLRGSLFLAEGLPYSVKDLCEAWEVAPDKGRALVEAFERLGLITQAEPTTPGQPGAWVVTNWDNRQYISDGPSTPRVKAHRKRKAQQELEGWGATLHPKGDGTLQDCFSETPQIRSDTEQKQSRADLSFPDPDLATAQGLWAQCLTDLNLGMAQGTWDNLLRGTEVVDYTPGPPMPRLTITVPRDQAIPWLTERLGPVIQTTIDRHYPEGTKPIWVVAKKGGS